MTKLYKQICNNNNKNVKRKLNHKISMCRRKAEYLLFHSILFHGIADEILVLEGNYIGEIEKHLDRSYWNSLVISSTVRPFVSGTSSTVKVKKSTRRTVNIRNV